MGGGAFFLIAALPPRRAAPLLPNPLCMPGISLSAPRRRGSSTAGGAQLAWPGPPRPAPGLAPEVHPAAGRNQYRQAHTRTPFSPVECLL